MNKKYKRHSTNAKYVIELGWRHLTETEKDNFVSIYNTQINNGAVLSFTFNDIGFGGVDIGPIDVKMQLPEIKRHGVDKFSLGVKLHEY